MRGGVLSLFFLTSSSSYLPAPLFFFVMKKWLAILIILPEWHAHTFGSVCKKPGSPRCVTSPSIFCVYGDMCVTSSHTVPYLSAGSDMSFLLSAESDQDQPTSELYPVYVVLAGLALLAFVVVGMVASRKRRREHGQLWFPEGFKTSEPSKKKRREPVGEDSVGLK